MKVRYFILITIFILHNICLARSPGIPLTHKELNQKIIEYKELKKNKSFIDLEKSISLFENIYNTNQVKSKLAKNRIFCILREFYLSYDSNYAKVFSKNLPHLQCSKKI